MLKYIVTLATFITTTATAGDYRLFAPRDVYIDTYKNSTVHDPYLYPADKDLSYGANFVVDLDIAKYKGYGLYMLNKLHFDQSEKTGKIVHVGWQYEIGLTLFPTHTGYGQLEVFLQHHSRHILEEEREAHFPVYDRFGVRVRIWP